MAADVDADLGHDCDGLRSHASSLGAGAEDLEAITGPCTKHPFRHLRAGAVVGTYEEDALLVHRSILRPLRQGSVKSERRRTAPPLVYLDLVNVSELAALAGVATSAVRFYERTGVLPHARRRPNGYRAYGADDLARLRLVITLRRLGLDAREAGRLAALCVEGVANSVAGDLVERIGAQRDAIARQRAELDQLEAELVDLELTAGMAVLRSPGVNWDGSRRPTRVVFVCTGKPAYNSMLASVAGTW